MNARILHHGWGKKPPIQITLLEKLLHKHGDYSKVARVLQCSPCQVRDYWRKHTKHSDALDSALSAAFPEHTAVISASNPYVGRQCKVCGGIVDPKRARAGAVFCCEDCHNEYHGISSSQGRWAPSTFYRRDVHLPEWFACQNAFTAYDRSAVCA